MNLTTFAPGSLEVECPGGLDWAWTVFGECIRNTRDKVSIAFGVLSIAAWFMFGFPQMATNCIKKIPDEAVSPFLLLFWLLGDSLNLIGSILTNQLLLQKVLAAYTVVIDLILIFQYVYYLLRHRKHQKKLAAVGDVSHITDETSKFRSNSNSGRRLATCLLGVVACTSVLGSTLLTNAPPPHIVQTYIHGRQLLELQPLQATTTVDPFADFLSTWQEKFGYAIGWIGAVMYFCSRGPQIYTNFRRKTTEGLSVYLFLLAVLGNVFYGLQIFIKSIDVVFVVTSLPWILGSLGILVFDFVILGQFFCYRHNMVEQDIEVTLEYADSKEDISGPGSVF